MRKTINAFKTMIFDFREQGIICCKGKMSFGNGRIFLEMLEIFEEKSK
jgi:hypothetical protein